MTRSHEIKSISRSARLRKYESAYEEYFRKVAEISKKNPTNTLLTPKKSRSKRKTNREEEISVKKSSLPKKKSKEKKSLNEYQKFVKEESQKNKYKGITSTERMIDISKEWSKQKCKKEK